MIAQQDEDRLRGLPGIELSNGIHSTTYEVAENGMCLEKSAGAWKYWEGTATTSCEAATGYKGKAYTGTVFTVTSMAQFVSASKETLTCETTGGAANYIQTTTSVNWSSANKHSPVTESSLVTVPTNASLLVRVKNSKTEAVSGAKVAVTDPSTASTVTAEQTTPASGCVIFGDLAVGMVKVVASKEGWVEKTGKAAVAKETTLTKTSLAEVEFTIEDSGGILAKFVNSAGTEVQGSTFVAFQTGLGSPAFEVGGEPSKPVTSYTLEGLYPYAEDYKAWAGDCEANKPATVGVAGAKEGSVLVKPGAVEPVQVEEAPINVTVYEGTSGTPGGHPADVETAMIIDTSCSSTQHKVTLNSAGNIVQKYQPYAKELEFCVVALISGKYYKYKSPTKFENKLTTGTTIPSVYLKETTSGYSNSSSKLTCP